MMENEEIDNELYAMTTYLNSVKALSICYALKRLMVNERNHTQYVNDVQSMMNNLLSEQLPAMGIPVNKYLIEQMDRIFEKSRNGDFDPWSSY